MKKKKRKNSKFRSNEKRKRKRRRRRFKDEANLRNEFYQILVKERKLGQNLERKGANQKASLRNLSLILTLLLKSQVLCLNPVMINDEAEELPLQEGKLLLEDLNI
jgi:hypothetical protein